MSALDSFEDLIRQKIERDHATHHQICEELTTKFPGKRGFSVRSIRRFCKEKNIHKTSRMSASEVKSAVQEGVLKVGPTYGRKTMCGLLAAEGMRIAESRVRTALHEINPRYQKARQQRTERQLNPKPYSASHFGDKIHIDQNEKLVMFGITHICAIDGYSGKIVGFISMPVKNNLEIYEHLFRPILLEYGLWDQVRVDQGKEWILSLFVQEQLQHLRHNTTKPPHRQTTSKLNHTVERCWPEVNARVNYPIKSCLIKMEENAVIDMDSPVHKFCVSWFTLRVANTGTTLVVKSWNEHRIPGKGVPNRRSRTKDFTNKLRSSDIPTTDEAVQQFTALGGRLTMFSPFGGDPLESRPDLIAQRDAQFITCVPSFAPVFHAIVNGDDQQFQDGLKTFIQLTEQLIPFV